MKLLYYAIIPVIIIFIFYGFNIYLYKKEYFAPINVEDKSNNYIPKIIHQTAPANKEKWNEVWYKCQESWFEKFPSPEYEYKMWNDEDLDKLIKYDFPWFYKIYQNYDKNIKRIDIARCFILYKYGGIYADMDYMCMKNFYDLLPPNKVSISQSPHPHNEYIQNALMASNINNNFWLKVIEEAKNRTTLGVLDSTGPRLLTNIYFENTNDVNILPKDLFNPLSGTLEFDSDIVYTKHFGSCSWC
jgi:mannosyltransferase OCH1-like enzyme